jgi:arylsulfatase
MTFNPTTPQGFPGTIGRTIAESTPHFPSHDGDGTKPNILIVLLDDVGFADFGCYGS